ncbi:hypothetical protein E2C01_058003 [Portunus trituberculatus]|uniref:Uncharacterized protein n=1 Tax=Portunus trituberculatus TaxID=210409 RepID=A0A5B7H2L8_PORTR|nr:hypothetical protein [Portunus trituberculatus]
MEGGGSEGEGGVRVNRNNYWYRGEGKQGEEGRRGRGGRVERAARVWESEDRGGAREGRVRGVREAWRARQEGRGNTHLSAAQQVSLRPLSLARGKSACGGWRLPKFGKLVLV